MHTAASYGSSRLTAQHRRARSRRAGVIPRPHTLRTARGWRSCGRQGQRGRVPSLSSTSCLTGGGEPRCLTDHPLGAGAPVWKPGLHAGSPTSRAFLMKAATPRPRRGGAAQADHEPLQYREDNLGFFIDRRSQVFVVDPFAEPAAEPVQVTAGDFDQHRGCLEPGRPAKSRFVSARHDTRDSDLVADIWRCAPDGSELERSRAPRTASPGCAIDQICCRARTVSSVYFTAAELGQNGRDMLGRNIGFVVGPCRRVSAATAPHRSETIHLVRGAAIAATPEGVLAQRRIPWRRRIAARRRVRGRAAAADRRPAPGRRVGVGGSVRLLSSRVLAQAASSSRSPKEPNASSPLSPRSLRHIPCRKSRPPSPDGYPVHGWIVRPEGPVRIPCC